MEHLCDICPLENSRLSAATKLALEAVLVDPDDQHDKRLLAATNDTELLDAIAESELTRRCDRLMQVLPFDADDKAGCRSHPYSECAQVRLMGLVVQNIHETPDAPAV